MTEHQAYDLATGMEVATADGKRVGTVKEISGNQFKVDAPLRPDYWLGVEHIHEVTADRVLLDIEHGRLEEHKAEGYVEEDMAAGYKPAGVAPIATDNDPGMQPSEYLAEAPSELPDAVPGVRMGKPEGPEGAVASVGTVTPSLNPAVVPVDSTAHGESQQPYSDPGDTKRSPRWTQDSDERAPS